MTHDRRFKKRVRARIAKTGESYSTALRRLRASEEQSRMSQINELQPLVEHDFVYALLIPSSWRSYAADIYNSPLEVARYMRDGPDVAPGIVNVFWGTRGDSPREIAENQKASLENAEIDGQTSKAFAIDDCRSMARRSHGSIPDQSWVRLRTGCLDPTSCQFEGSTSVSTWQRRMMKQTQPSLR